MTEKKRKSKVGAPRTEVFAMRFDPKLKYLSELAARKQRRSLANFVEWAIEQALARVLVKGAGSDGDELSIADASKYLWALDEPERLVKLATVCPDLLSYDEQLIWRVICEHSVYNQAVERESVFKNQEDFDVALVRACWPEIKAFALEGGTIERLNVAICSNDCIPV